MKKLLLFGFIFQSVINAQNISSLLPDSVEGWKISNKPEIYIGEDLFRLINGGADIYHEYGFKQVITQRYVNVNDNVISVEIYEMIDSSAAFGIFSLFTFSTGKPINFSSGASEGDGFLLFWKGNYFITLSGYNSSAFPSSRSDELKNGFFLIAESIESNITSAGKPMLVETFDQIANSQIAYIKGNLGLYNLSNLDIGRNLKVEEGICLEKESSVNFIFKYETEEESNINFLSLTNELKSQSKYNLINSEVSSFLFKDYEDKYYYINQSVNFIIISSAVDTTLISTSIKEIKKLLK